jgi:hypothetical protein
MTGSSQLQEFELQMKKLEISKNLHLKQMLESNDPDTLIKAQLYLEDVEKRQSSGIKSIIFDPNETRSSDGYRAKNTNLTFGTLRAMSRTPMISAIIKTRVEQVSEFTRPQQDRFQPGFIVQPKQKTYFTQGEPKKPEISKDMQKRIDGMVEFLMNCGEESNRWHGDTFDSLTRKVIPDSLSLDQGTFEVVRSRDGKPLEIIATDAATMRIADTYDDDESNKKAKEILGYLPSYVQVIDGNVKAEYYPWELCFGVRNPQTSIYSNGYGKSELEELMNVVTWMLNSDTYNGKFFSQGAAPKGIIKVSGNVNGARLQEFRQSWQATTASVANAHKVPVIESENMDWIDLQKGNRDMEFSQWQEYLIKVACAIYKIDPSEVFDLTNSKPGFHSDNQSENIKYSRDKGLEPLLKSYEKWINKYIVNPYDDELELRFVGIDTESEQAELELDIKRGSSFMGYQELRDKYNLGELAEDDVILSPTYIQYLGQKQQADQMESMGGEQGMQSNQFMDEEYGAEEQEQPRYFGKGEEHNPFVDELNKFVKKNLLQ